MGPQSSLRVTIEDPAAFLDAVEAVELLHTRSPRNNMEIAMSMQEPYKLMELTEADVGTIRSLPPEMVAHLSATQVEDHIIPGGSADEVSLRVDDRIIPDGSAHMAAEVDAGMGDTVAADFAATVAADLPADIHQEDSGTMFVDEEDSGNKFPFDIDDTAEGDIFKIVDFLGSMADRSDDLFSCNQPITILDSDCDLEIVEATEADVVPSTAALAHPRGDDCDESRASAFFHHMDEVQPLAVKRRRLRNKQSTSIPGNMGMPAQNLKEAARSRGLRPATFQRMVLAGIPMVVLNAFVWMEAMAPSRDARKVSCSELFSGIGIISGAWDEHNYETSRFDISHDELFENILSAEGWMTAMRMMRDTHPHGMTSIATVCSSWIYLSRCTTGRSSMRPLGDRSVDFVVDGNCMCARVSILLVLGTCMLLCMLHEQPATSLIPITRYFMWGKDKIKTELASFWAEMFTWLGAFGHDTCKPTQLIGNRRWLLKLQRHLTKAQLADLLPDAGVHHLPCDPATLRPRVKGASGLKSSQAYPADFGRAVRDLWKENEEGIMQSFQDEVISDEEEVPWGLWQQSAANISRWSDLRLSDVVDLVGVPTDRPL